MIQKYTVTKIDIDAISKKKLNDALEELYKLQDILNETRCSFRTTNGNLFDREDLFWTIDLLATLVHPGCNFF